MTHANMLIDDGRFFIMRDRSLDQEIASGGLYVRRGIRNVLLGKYGINQEGHWHVRVAASIEDANQSRFQEIAIIGIDTKRNDAIFTLWRIRNVIDIAINEITQVSPAQPAKAQMVTPVRQVPGA